MPLLSLRQKRVAEEKGCSHNVISALCLLDLAVTRVSTALVEEKEKKPSEDIAAVFCGKYLFSLPLLGAAGSNVRWPSADADLRHMFQDTI